MSTVQFVMPNSNSFESRGVGREGAKGAAPPPPLPPKKREERGEKRDRKKKENRGVIRERKLNQSFQEHVFMGL